MAPLKLDVSVDPADVPRPLPCLKGHGPIEALILNLLGRVAALLPCLKGHGPIEATGRRIRGNDPRTGYHV